MTLIVILIVILIVTVVGAPPTWPHTHLMRLRMIPDQDILSQTSPNICNINIFDQLTKGKLAWSYFYTLHGWFLDRKELTKGRREKKETTGGGAASFPANNRKRHVESKYL